LSSPSRPPDQLLGPQSLLFIGYWDIFLAVKCPGWECLTTVKSCTSAVPYIFVVWTEATVSPFFPHETEGNFKRCTPIGRRIKRSKSVLVASGGMCLADGAVHGTIRTAHTSYAAALKTATHPKTRCRKPYVAT
jgi:hypothetical protein